MKKLVLTTVTLAFSAVLGFSQGAIILNTTSALATTNNGVVSGAAAGNGAFVYAVLDMTASAYGALSGGQQASITNVRSSSILTLWNDTGVAGTTSSLHAGGIAGTASASGNTANNWAQPTPNTTYNTASSYDYFIIVGWSANEGANWLTVSNELYNGTLLTTAGSWFGVSALAYNYAGVLGGSPAPVTVWGTSAVTGLAGSGGLTGIVLNPVTVVGVPEPSTMALAGLGGASLLLFRRRKIK